MELPAASHRPRIAAGLIFTIQAPRPPPPALAALGHPATGLIFAIRAPKPPPPTLADARAPGGRPHLHDAGSQAAPSRPRSARAPSPTSWGRGETGELRLSHAVEGAVLNPRPTSSSRSGLPSRPLPPSLTLGHPPPLREGGEKWGRHLGDLQIGNAGGSSSDRRSVGGGSEAGAGRGCSSPAERRPMSVIMPTKMARNVRP